MVEVSLICTVKNEEGSIGRLVDSLLSQTRPPDEIVIVDGGSTDRTTEVVDAYIRARAPIRLILREGANISQGRNTAIRSASHEIIASTDAGCELERTWLEELIRPFEQDPSIDVVAGSYRYSGINHFERVVARIMSRRMPVEEDETLPSSRSIAFKKSAWESVGGYPEGLKFAEDTRFDLDLKAKGCRFAAARDAVAVWRMRGSPQSVYKQCFNYSRWDIIAGNPSSRQKMWKVTLGAMSVLILAPLLALQTPIGLALLSLVLLYYFIRYGAFLYLSSSVVQDLFNGPLVVSAMTLGDIAGTISGVLEKNRFPDSIQRDRDRTHPPAP